MAFSTSEIRELFAEETERLAELERVHNLTWCYRFRSGRHEGHDIPPLPREVSCRGCRGEFCSAHALRGHLRQTKCGGKTAAQRRAACRGIQHALQRARR